VVKGLEKGDEIVKGAKDKAAEDEDEDEDEEDKEEDEKDAEAKKE
jgi:hypothetical protein